MIEIKGTYNTAVVFSDTVEDSAADQIRTVCDMEAFGGSRIRIMPDVHAGIGCTIGTTMTVDRKVVPGMVGVDIGCGIDTLELAGSGMDFPWLDEIIRRNVPSGRGIRDSPHQLNDCVDLTRLRCAGKVDLARASLSVGTLGGGNHFIEVAESDDGRQFLTVHSGSRHLGSQVAAHYRDLAWKGLKRAAADVSGLVSRLRAEGREREIQAAVREAKRAVPALPKDLACLSGAAFDDYLHDMKIVQEFASLNRKAMIEVIVGKTGAVAADRFTTVHNYIDTDSLVLRKGAVSARLGERLLIPINMRDGSLVCVGKGNDDWNQSAPHGAGRIMGRRHALKTLSLDGFRDQMAGIFTTSVSGGTLDESPSAYRSLETIAASIGPTAEIVLRLKTVYNFKAAG